MKSLIRILLLPTVLIFTTFLDAKSEDGKTVCLNMIVKNESAVIVRCLESTLPIIDYWVIVDTGSTDGTQEIIKEFMKSKNVHGELHERPWVNFAHNRNQALELAKDKADYVLIMDADEYLKYDPHFKLSVLDKDCYYMTISYGGTRYSRVQVMENHLDWKYVGVLHEALEKGERSSGSLSDVLIMCTPEGARSKDPLKYQKDAALLEAALKEEPSNTRYVFYLAQSYRDAGDHQKALVNYEKRAKMGGWDEEVFWSLLEVGKLQEALDMPPEKFIESYTRAYRYRPSRVEPLYFLSHYYRKAKVFEKGRRIAELAMTVPQTNDILFVQQWMINYAIPLEYSICAYWLDQFDECERISMQLLKRDDLPSHVRECVEKNLGFSKSKIVENLCLEKD